jgi:arginine decarboxylase
MLASTVGMKHTNEYYYGLTCDSDDYYNSEQNMNAIYLPKYNKETIVHGFFYRAYQETIGGYGGLHHCLIPQPNTS